MRLEEFRKYWDDWHNEWKKTVSNGTITNNTKIKGWPLPKKKSTYLNFPEPYWGGYSNKLYGIFLSINPGNPQEHHSIISTNKNHENYCLYYPNQGDYRNIIENISKQEYNITIDWMNSRVEWLGKVIPEHKSELSLNNVLLTDLVPWHTEKKSMITNYFEDGEVRVKMIENVLLPIIEISKTIIGPMKQKIIVRGTSLLDLFNDSSILTTLFHQSHLKIENHELYVVLDEKDKTFSKFMSLLTLFKIGEATFYIFSGGSSMNLPDQNYRVYPIKNCSNKINFSESISLKKFITG